MPSEESLDWRLTHLEDQVNQLNLIIADQGQKIDNLSYLLSRVATRLKSIEEDQGEASMDGSTGILSDRPPDGSNR